MPQSLKLPDGYKVLDSGKEPNKGLYRMIKRPNGTVYKEWYHLYSPEELQRKVDAENKSLGQLSSSNLRDNTKNAMGLTAATGLFSAGAYYNMSADRQAKLKRLVRGAALGKTKPQGVGLKTPTASAGDVRGRVVPDRPPAIVRSVDNPTKRGSTMPQTGDLFSQPETPKTGTRGGTKGGSGTRASGSGTKPAGSGAKPAGSGTRTRGSAKSKPTPSTPSRPTPLNPNRPTPLNPRYTPTQARPTPLNPNAYPIPLDPNADPRLGRESVLRPDGTRTRYVATGDSVAERMTGAQTRAANGERPLSRIPGARSSSGTKPTPSTPSRPTPLTGSKPTFTGRNPLTGETSQLRPSPMGPPTQSGATSRPTGSRQSPPMSATGPEFNASRTVVTGNRTVTNPGAALAPSRPISVQNPGAPIQTRQPGGALMRPIPEAKYRVIPPQPKPTGGLLGQANDFLKNLGKRGTGIKRVDTLVQAAGMIDKLGGEPYRQHMAAHPGDRNLTPMQLSEHMRTSKLEAPKVSTPAPAASSANKPAGGGTSQKPSGPAYFPEAARNGSAVRTPDSYLGEAFDYSLQKGTTSGTKYLEHMFRRDKISEDDQQRLRERFNKKVVDDQILKTYGADRGITENVEGKTPGLGKALLEKYRDTGTYKGNTDYGKMRSAAEARLAASRK